MSVLLIISVIPVCLLLQNQNRMGTPNNEKYDLEKLYEEMYSYMISKDIESLEKLLDDDLVLVHMTGMRQPKKDYLKAISNGTLNYFSCEDSEIKTDIQGSKARLTGKSKVNVAVFGGGRNTWRLQLDLDLINKEGNWLITEIRASTY